MSRTSAASRRARKVCRAVCESLERRTLLAAPQVIAPPSPDPFAGTPDGHFYAETSPHRLILGFDQPVTLDSAALALTNLTTGGDITQLAHDAAGDTHTWTINTTGDNNVPHALPRGNYELALNRDLVFNVALEKLAADYTSSFFFQPGDANHDRTVGPDDHARIDNNW